MHIPKLKRVKVSSEDELRNWLAKNAELRQDVMIVTCNMKSRDKHISSNRVRELVREKGWNVGRSYTLSLVACEMSVLGKIPCKSTQNREITKNRTDPKCELRRRSELGGCGEACPVSGEGLDSKAFEYAQEFKPKRARQKF